MASDKVLAKRLRAWSRRWVVSGMGAALVALESGKGLPRTSAARLRREFERAAVKPGFRASERAAGAWLTRELAARAAGAPAAKKRRKKVDDAPRVVRAARKVKRAVQSGAGVEASARIGRARVGAAVGVRSNPSRKAKRTRNPSGMTIDGWHFEHLDTVARWPGGVQERGRLAYQVERTAYDTRERSATSRDWEHVRKVLMAAGYTHVSHVGHWFTWVIGAGKPARQGQSWLPVKPR